MIPGSISVDIKFAAKTYESRFKQHSKNHDNVVIKSINNVFPFGSMPDSISKPNSKQCKNARNSCSIVTVHMFSTVLTEFLKMRSEGDWIKNVIFKPGSESDMPSAPELINGSGEERPLKVLF